MQSSETPENKIDIFLSHATEDKDFVKQLADTLIRLGRTVWYDDYVLTVGDSIRDQINRGLRECRFGVVVLSPNFFAKNWPKQELAALAATATEPGRILPVMLEITHAEVAAADPLLADTYALNANSGTSTIASRLAAKASPQLGIVDAAGRRYIRDEVIRLVDYPRDGDGKIRNVEFDNCLLQGPAVLMSAGGCLLTDVVFNSPYVFWRTELGRPYIGCVGLENVSIVGGRLKDVSIALAEPEFSEVVNSIPFTDSGHTWTGHLS